jgi:DNA repair exonuclease SbcCD nuclease subunit
MTAVNKLNKSAMLTDIHWGKKANSDVHNQDCMNYIDWFCEQVRADPEIDHILFLGDWHENRSALNISTLKQSFLGAKKIDDLGLPVFFIIGNHDLYHRHSREIHSVLPFQELKNFIIIEEPTIVENIGNGMLLSPYLFHNEYPDLERFLKIPVWAGHFEFKGFVITGHTVTMPTGPNPTDYEGPKKIFSGHFHKRQAHNQVVYIGNTFPMDFGDAGDDERGMATYNHESDETIFINWEECPRYVKTTLSDIIEENVKIHPDSRVKCIVDIPVSFEESTYIRQKYLDDFKLREFTMEESAEIGNSLSGTETTVDTSAELASVNELVLQMLHEIESNHINNNMLVDIYKSLK